MGFTTSELVDRLQVEGFQVTAGYLSYLLRECPILKPETRVSSLYLWHSADIERLKAALKERRRGPAATPISHKELAQRVRELSATAGYDLLGGRRPEAVPFAELRAIAEGTRP